MSAKMLSYLNPNIHSYDSWEEFEHEKTIHENINIHEIAHDGNVNELKRAIGLLLEQTDYECLEDGSLESSINLKDERGNTPLLNAIDGNQFEMAETLILFGADINLKSTAGVSPFDKANEMHNDKILRALIESGASLNI